MRFLTRAAVSAAAAALAATLAPTVPAHAAGGWEYVQSPSIMIGEKFWTHGHIDGRPGNWHEVAISVQQDDDGVTGGLFDLRCPKGVKPDVHSQDNCEVVGGADFVDELGLTVTRSKHLKRVHVYGDIVLDDYFTDELVTSSMDLRILARGEFSRTVTYAAPTSTDPMEYKTVHIRRSGVTARGFMDSVAVSPSTIRLKNTEPLHVYWIKGRIPTI